MPPLLLWDRQFASPNCLSLNQAALLYDLQTNRLLHKRLLKRLTNDFVSDFKRLLIEAADEVVQDLRKTLNGAFSEKVRLQIY